MQLFGTRAGYLTPPGGGAPYWADCWYPLFAAYICCNGFALVFSAAAIMAVLIGPIVLVCLDRSSWRKQIAILAIMHLVFSLASLLAAFALAGFITASVSAPPFNCGNLKCEEGGVPCSAYTVAYTGRVAAQYNFTSDKLGGLFSPVSTASLDFYRDLTELVLDPAVARLNKDVFGDASALGSPGPDVLCRDYRYIANGSLPDGRPVFGPMNDTHGKPLSNPCYVLLDANFNRTLAQARIDGIAQSGWRTFKPNAHTLWCSTNASVLGPGWLPLTFRTGYYLLRNCRPEAFNGFHNAHEVHPPRSHPRAHHAQH